MGYTSKGKHCSSTEKPWVVTMFFPPFVLTIIANKNKEHRIAERLWKEVLFKVDFNSVFTIFYNQSLHSYSPIKNTHPTKYGRKEEKTEGFREKEIQETWRERGEDKLYIPGITRKHSSLAWLM
jgi:hypothetical protein